MEKNYPTSAFSLSNYSFPDGNWLFPDYDDHSLDTNSQTFHPVTYMNDSCYDSDHTSSSYPNYNAIKDTSIENYQQFPSNSALSMADADDENSPFSPRCRIPVPDLTPMSRYQLWLETSFMCRRNERERQRVRNVNDGFSRLRNHLPRTANMRRRQSKVETLQHAIKYIKYLQNLLQDKKENDGSEPE